MILALVLSTAFLSSTAEAQPESLEAARQLYVDGTDLFRVGKFQEALSAFEQSHEYAASPNASLMIGRCLDRVGELEAAHEWLRRTEVDAETRISAGETKYEPTRDAARAELASLRQRIGFIKILVTGDRTDLSVETAYARERLEGPELEIPHRPGDARLRFKRGEVLITERVERVVAAGHIDVLVDVGSPSKPPLAVPTETDSRGVPTLAAAGVVTGVGLVAAAITIGLGVHTEGLYDELSERCSPSKPCGDADSRDLAERGEDSEKLTNIMAVVAGAHGLVAGAMFIAGAVQASSGDSVSVSVSPGFASLRVRF